DTLRTRQALNGDPLTQALRAIIRSEGVGSLYSGVMSPCLFTGIWKGVTLFTHRQLQHLLARHRGFDVASQLTVLEVACCASVAGAVGGAVLAPAELIKSRSQICSEPHSSPFQKELNQVRALFRPGASPSRACRGLPLLLLRDGPATFVDLGCYELVKRYGQARDWPWYLSSAAAGILAAPAGWTSIYPIEIIRIRYQGELRWNTYGEVARHVYATR
ncbi:mcfS, partial [Symbiodinium necroappetens]